MTTINKSQLEFSLQLEKRLLALSKQAYSFCKQIPRDRINIEYADQFNRSTSSVGANYIEANESESSRDFVHRLKISKKEAKEARYWLEIIINANPGLEPQALSISKELLEMVKLFSSIINKFSLKQY
jgi:four helix bundle protein